MLVFFSFFLCFFTSQGGELGRYSERPRLHAFLLPPGTFFFPAALRACVCVCVCVFVSVSVSVSAFLCVCVCEVSAFLLAAGQCPLSL